MNEIRKKGREQVRKPREKEHCWVDEDINV